MLEKEFLKNSYSYVLFPSHYRFNTGVDFFSKETYIEVYTGGGIYIAVALPTIKNERQNQIMVRVLFK